MIEDLNGCILDLISEPDEIIMYNKQHKRNDLESLKLRELEKKYHFETNDELNKFLELASEKLEVSQKEAYRKLIHFLGDNFSDIIVYEELWDEQYPREKDSWLMTYSNEQWSNLWEYRQKLNCGGD